MILNRSFSGQIVNAGFQYVAPVGDTTPDNIQGQTINNAQLSAWIEFDPVQITGIDATVLATISGGQFAVSTDGITYGAFSSVSQSVENTYWIKVRVLSSDTYATSANASLNVGGVTAAFTANTWSGVYTSPKYLMLITEASGFRSTLNPLSIPAGTYAFNNDGSYIPDAPHKDPNSTMDYGVYWANWLAAGEIIVSSQWALNGLTQQTSLFIDTETKAMISGGTNNTLYLATNRITTNAGRSEERSMYILCQDR